MSGRGGERGRGWRAESLALAFFPLSYCIHPATPSQLHQLFFLAVGVSGLAWGKGWGNKTSMFGVFFVFQFTQPPPLFFEAVVALGIVLGTWSPAICLLRGGGGNHNRMEEGSGHTDSPCLLERGCLGRGGGNHCLPTCLPTLPRLYCMQYYREYLDLHLISMGIRPPSSRPTNHWAFLSHTRACCNPAETGQTKTVVGRRRIEAPKCLITAFSSD